MTKIRVGLREWRDYDKMPKSYLITDELMGQFASLLHRDTLEHHDECKCLACITFENFKNQIQAQMKAVDAIGEYQEGEVPNW